MILVSALGPNFGLGLGLGLGPGLDNNNNLFFSCEDESLQFLMSVCLKVTHGYSRLSMQFRELYALP